VAFETANRIHRVRLVWGSELKGTGEFDPRDPHQTRLDQANAAERPRFNTGILRLISEEENRPPLLQYVECGRGLHLGWIGVHASIRPFDIVDFILGWTPLDIVGDDEKNLQERADRTVGMKGTPREQM
jgi:hypothetical protein